MRISLLICLFFTINLFSEDFIIEKPQSQEKLALALIYHDDAARVSAEQISEILVTTGLLSTRVIKAQLPVTQQQIRDYCRNGFPVVLFVEKQGDTVAWRLYDATQIQMLLGKSNTSNSPALTVRLVADAVYKHLFNHTSYFLTRIAYIQKSPTISNKKRTKLCTIDPVNHEKRIVLADNRTLVAPQWCAPHSGAVREQPWLNVSEFTPQNVRLLGVDLTGSVWSIIDAPGTCVGTAQCQDNSFVYARSGALWLYEFDAVYRKGRHTRLTDGVKTCACPSVLRSGDIIFGCNGKICRYERASKKIEQLPISGTSFAPDAHSATDRILFSRAVNGTLQVFCTDSWGNNLKQLTFGSGNKIDACWSPCGNYIAYTRRDKKREQIAICNLINHHETILTSEYEQCGYPSWSQPSVQLY